MSRGKRKGYIREFDAEVIEAFLREKNIKRSALSKLIGRSRDYCASILRGRYPLSPEMVKALEYLGLDREKYIKKPEPIRLELEMPADHPSVGMQQTEDLYTTIRRAMYDALEAYFGGQHD